MLSEHFKEMSYPIVPVASITAVHKESIIVPNRSQRSDIERLWCQALERNPALFNDRVLSIIDIEGLSNDAISPHLILHTCFVEYKTVMAAKDIPALNAIISPIGVSGITICSDALNEYLVFAERSSSVTQYPGYMELVPSGNISDEMLTSLGTIDYKCQLMQEWLEETQQTNIASIESIQEVALVYDRQANVYDICCVMRASLSPSVLEEGLMSSPEYSKPMVVPISDAAVFIQRHHNRIVPTSLLLLEALRDGIIVI